MAGDTSAALTRYLPRAVFPPRPGAGSRFWAAEGSMVFSDVSGFTKLSERLARKGKSGAEELVAAISHVFTHLLRVNDLYGGDVLKFGGDALLLWFGGHDHLARACATAHEMRRTLRRVGTIRTSSGSVTLRMSQGIHSGSFDFFLVGGRHEELVVAGPAATMTVEMESAADAQEVLLSPDAAARIDPRRLGPEKAGGRLLLTPPPAPQVGPIGVAESLRPDDLEVYVPIAVRGRLDSLFEESEHRQVAVGFMHFFGLDDLLVTWGPAEVHRRLDSLSRAVVDAMAEYEVCVICTDIGPDGGKFMLASGAPEAHEDADERMLRAARAVLEHDHGLQVRIGVNRGHVYAGAVGAPFRHTYSTMGDAVNLAARVMGKAGVGQLLATAAVMAHCEGRFEAESLPPFMVKGKSHPVNAFVVGAVTGATRRRPVARRAPFVGRPRELKLMEEAYAEASEGRGRVIEIVGDAGSGKSRLVDEFVDRVAPERLLTVSCEQYESNTPYFVARAILRSLLGIPLDAEPESAGPLLAERVGALAPGLRPWLPLLGSVADADVPPTPEVDALLPRFRRDRLREVVDQLVAAALDRRAVLAVEDAGWMDDASAELLVHLFGSVDRLPVVVCVTRRPEDRGLHSGRGYAADVVELGPLDPSDAQALATAVREDLTPHAAERLAQHSAGNPLFLLELVSSAGGQIDLNALPDDVESIVSSRLDRLAPRDRRVLRYAAVLGSHFREDEFRSGLGREVDTDPAVWDRLSEFVVRERDGTLRFATELFRRVAYEALPFSRRRAVHAQVGEVLEREGTSSDERLGLLSLHFHAAQRYDKSWLYSVEAGDHARGIWANLEAAAFYRRALDAARHLRNVPGDELARVCEAMGDATEVTAQYDEAAVAYTKARRAGCAEEQRRPGPADPGTVVASARLMLKRGIVSERQGRYVSAVRWYARGMRTLGSIDAPDALEVRAKLLVGFAAVRYRQGRMAESAAWAEQAAEAANAAGHRPTLAHAFYLLDTAYSDLGRPEARQYRGIALPIFEEIGDLVGQANVLNNMGIYAYYEGRWQEALRLYERSRETRVRVGDVMGAATAANNIGEILADQGDLAAAEALFAEARRVFRSVRYPVGAALATCNLGRVAARTGRFDEAVAHFSEALSGFRAIKAETFVVETQARVAEMLLLRGAPEEALQLVTAASRLAGSQEMAFARLVLDRVAGLALVQAGRLEEGRQGLIQSVQVAEAVGAEYEAAVTLRALAVVERRLGLARAVERVAASDAVFARLEVRDPPDYDRIIEGEESRV